MNRKRTALAGHLMFRDEFNDSIDSGRGAALTRKHFSGEESSAPGHIRIFAAPDEGEKAPREIPLDALGQAVASGIVVWIDVILPAAKAASLLGDTLDLDPLAVEDALIPLRMPKFDPLSNDGAFVAAFSIWLLGGSEPRLPSKPVALVVGPRYLVTLSWEPVPEMAARLDSALRPESAPAPISGSVLAHQALDALIDRHLPVMLKAAEVAEDLEDSLDPRAERRGLTALESLIVLRRDLLAFRRLAVAQQEVLRRFGRAFPEMQSSLADVADTEREAIDTAAATCDFIDGAIEAYRVRRDAQTEDGIRRLSVLAGVFGPVSLLIALWGLNFPDIPGTQSPAGWPIFVSLQVMLTLIGVWYFRRQGML